MIVQGNKIVEIGAEEDRGENFSGKMINLEGQLVIPGLHDAHIHNYSLGRLQSRLRLHGTSSVEDLQDKLQKFQTSQDWIIGHGWDQDEMKNGRYPNKSDIDQIEAERPVLLYRACNHIGLVNTKALEIMGITSETPDPIGGKIDRDTHGEVTGILREEGLTLVSDYIAHLDEDYRMDYYKAGLKSCLENGLTSIHTNDGQAWKYYSKLAEMNELPIRVFLTLKYSDLDKEAYIPSPGEQKGLLTCKRVKLFADGSLGAETAALRENYQGLDHNGILIDQQEVINEKIQRIASMGYQLEVHAIGDKATEVVINGFKQAGLTKEHKPMITHCQVMALDLIKEMADLGYIANIQPPFVPTDARWAEKRLGRGERLQYSYAWKTLIENGVIVTGGSDAPIESPNPFWGIYCAIMRPDPDGNSWRMEESLTFDEALEIYTVNPAYAINNEDKLGSIEKGYLADFIICDPDIFFDAEKLRERSVKEVWVDGIRRFQISR